EENRVSSPGIEPLFGVTRQRAKLVSALKRPVCIKPRAVIERFLRPDACCREPRIQIGAPHCLWFRYSLREEYSETPDERVACAGAVDTFYSKRSHVFAYSAARQERSVGSQSDDHPANPAGYELLRAC